MFCIFLKQFQKNIGKSNDNFKNLLFPLCQRHIALRIRRCFLKCLYNSSVPQVFPRRSRQEIEAMLARCKGDVVAAMDLMINGCGSTPPAYNLTQESPPYLQNYQSKSAFSPLSNQSFKFSPSRRFLTPPYSGTGYLPTVIRPPPEYLSSFLPPTDLMYGRQLQVPSPGTSPTSDNTNNEGFSDQDSESLKYLGVETGKMLLQFIASKLASAKA